MSLRIAFSAWCESHTTARTVSAGVHSTAPSSQGVASRVRAGGGGAIDVERGVGVALQERRGDLVVDLALDRAADDRGLVLAGGENHDLAGLEDRGDAHRDRLAGHVLLAEEVGGGVLPRHQVERDQPGPALGAGARLVEADVARAPDAEELEVDAAGGADRLLVAPDRGLGLVARQVAARDVHVGPRDVELGEEILPHEAMVGVDALRVHRVVLVQVERDHVAKLSPSSRCSRISSR